MLIQDLLMLSQSRDIEVKKNALEALTSVIHSSWAILRNSMRDVIG